MILVTGGTGLLGSYLLYHLSKEDKNIRAIYRSFEHIKKAKKVFAYYPDGISLFTKIEWFQADILDIESMKTAFEGVTQVYHLAGLVSFSNKNLKQLIEVNHIGTANIVNLALHYNVNKFCHVSSIAVLASKNNTQVNEDSYWDREKELTAYGYSKHLGECEVWRASQEGLAVVIIRPGIILGSGHWDHLSNLIMLITYKYQPRFYFPGSYGYIHANDTSKYMISLMNSEIINESFIAVTDHKSFKETQVIAAKFLSRKAPYKKAPLFLMRLLGLLEWILKTPFNKSIRLSQSNIDLLYAKTIYDYSKINKAVELKPQTIEDSLDLICSDYLKEKGGI